ncbi:MAG: hypothetical protein Q9212_002211 [Teloschistes hypoglaucus]
MAKPRINPPRFPHVIKYYVTSRRPQDIAIATLSYRASRKPYRLTEYIASSNRFFEISLDFASQFLQRPAQQRQKVHDIRVNTLSKPIRCAFVLAAPSYETGLMTIMSLLSLPYELISEIGRLLTLSELEAFALTSTFIYEVTVPIFEERGNTFHSLHFSRVRYDPEPSRSRETRDMSFFIATVSDHPYLRYYPIDLDFGEWQFLADDFNNQDDTEGRRDQAEEKLNTNFQKLIDICHHEIWSDQLGLGGFHNDQSYIRSAACPLFVLLPNLETINFVSTLGLDEKSAHDLSRLRTLVKTIANANRDSKSLCHNKALARLQSFRHEDDEYQVTIGKEVVNESIELLETVAMIPSMRDLSGINLIGLPGTLSIAPDTSNVTTLELWDCSISVQAFEVLLRGFKWLKEFSYTHSCWIYDYEGGSPYNAPGIVKALGNNAARSLKSLHLEATLWIDYLMYGEDEQYIGSLHMFQSLKFIHVQDQVFRIWEIIEDQSSDENNDESSAQHVLIPYSKRCGGSVPYRIDQLDNILPQSIETVQLDQTLSDNHIAKILQELTGKRKQKRVPHLTQIEFVHPIPVFGDTMKKALEDGGIEIISQDEPHRCNLNRMGFEIFVYP